MNVLKFGGTSVGSAQRIKDVARLICDETPKIVVLSAMSGTTDSLVEIADYLYKKNPDGANVILRRLTQTSHKDNVSALIYGLSYVRLMEQRGKDRRMRDFSHLLMYN